MKRSWLWIGSLVLFLPLIIPEVTSAQKTVGVVTALKGTAQLTRAATQTARSFKDNLILRDLIDTQEKSLTRVLFGGKSTVTVRELSRLEVREELLPGGRTRTIHDLSSGSILVNVAQRLLRRGDEVQIRTPNAIAAVRGTAILAQYNPALFQTIFILLTGSAFVVPLGQTSIPLAANTSVTISGTTATGVQVGPIKTVPQAEADKILEESEVGPARTEESAEALLQEAAQLTTTVLGGPVAAEEIVTVDPIVIQLQPICELCVKIQEEATQGQQVILTGVTKSLGAEETLFTFEGVFNSSSKDPVVQITNSTVSQSGSGNLVLVNSKAGQTRRTTFRCRSKHHHYRGRDPSCEAVPTVYLTLTAGV